MTTLCPVGPPERSCEAARSHPLPGAGPGITLSACLARALSRRAAPDQRARAHLCGRRRRPRDPGQAPGCICDELPVPRAGRHVDGEPDLPVGRPQPRLAFAVARLTRAVSSQLSAVSNDNQNAKRLVAEDGRRTNAFPPSSFLACQPSSTQRGNEVADARFEFVAGPAEGGEDLIRCLAAQNGGVLDGPVELADV